MDQISTKSQFSLEDFAYDLPEALIAQEPPAVRHASRLLLLDRRAQRFEDRIFTDLPDLLTEGDVLVVNDTKVLPARLLAHRETGGAVDILLLHPLAASPGVWLAMATPLRKLKPGERLTIDGANGYGLRVQEIVEAEGGQKRVLLDFGGQENVYRTLSGVGLAPLPPYIKRPDAEPQQRNSDLSRYQTIFARAPGAVAAPTAGLHFSDAIFERLEQRGVTVHRLTLHVGPGTFKPITGTLKEHSIEAEQFTITGGTAAAINQARAQGSRVIAVGTTSCRALETAGSSGNLVAQIDAETRLYVQPGYEFQIISGLLTNFHLSKSSLLVLVAAFGGYDLVMKAYRHAVEQRYRFFSYGDAMLIV
jgi:S-adenosylmethionine:tRNA ribosyltransferase-isomerase